MTKIDLIAAVAEETGLTKKDAEKAVNASFETIKAALAKGDKVSVAGFGVFEVHERAERKGMNPHTKQAITIPASKSPAFKAGKALKELVNS